MKYPSARLRFLNPSYPMPILTHFRERRWIFLKYFIQNVAGDSNKRLFENEIDNQVDGS
jgi:hypothetical protein